MESRARQLSCVYSSHVYVDGADLATLAVFFDEIWLPYPYEVDPDGLGLPGFKDAGIEGIGTYMLAGVQKEFREWKQTVKPLFDEGVLRTLPPPIRTADECPSDYLDVLHTKVARQSLPRGKVSMWDMALGKPAMAIFAAYSSKPAPELFLQPSWRKRSPTKSRSAPDTRTVHLASHLAISLFNYQVPQLQSLTADQILEVRNFLRNEKEGFVAHVFTLTDEMEKSAGAGVQWEEVAALKIVERKLIPQYIEFRRRLESKKTGFWANVLGAGAKFMQIDASPWTPKFYWGLFEAFTHSIDGRAKLEEESRSNAAQTFQYLAKLESTLLRD
jgi:hypothetical protein